ncbi:hypothetical protein [uncultured Halomonas sp.]|uniref:hypothetical protein n=1 Tax=uncultured Halomonas sp. TaxID=173971 RepID=UPI002632BBFF|nr:hypothetical protein [uncultured Halomonas sp.]
MNSYTIGVQRRATQRDIEKLTELAVEAIEERNEDALLSFAEHLIDQGLLASGVDELSLETSVKEMVIAYTETRDGNFEVNRWAAELAREQCENGLAA